MSSTYSSKRSSLKNTTTGVNGARQTISMSLPETPSALKQRPVFRSVPITPELTRLFPDENGLDLEILTHRLQLYQLEMEEAELRLKQRKSILEKQAADVAAAARFRSELDRCSSDQGSRQSRSTSMNEPSTARTSATSLSSPGSRRSERDHKPQPLQLSKASLHFQVGQDFPVTTQTPLTPNKNTSETKRHWRRTTISAGRNTNSSVIMVSSPGQLTEYDYTIPPVPQLSTSDSTAASPSTMSPLTPLPLTPLPTEDQLRRELETFALEQGPHIHMSRRSSAASRRKMPAAFVPTAADRINPPQPPRKRSETLTALVDGTDTLIVNSHSSPKLTRKRSFFGRFEKKDEVMDLLDLYMTDQQLKEEKVQKRKSTKLRRQLTKMWHSSDHVLQRSPKPGSPG